MYELISVKTILDKYGIKYKKVADTLNISPCSLSRKLKYNNFDLYELKLLYKKNILGMNDIADLLG